MARWRTIFPPGTDAYTKAPGGLYGPPSRTGRAAWHNGLDLAVPVGTPVLAPEAGTVAWTHTVDNDASGLHVGVRHADGVVTSYAHLSRVTVSPGQHVEQGDQLGLSGNTGSSTGPHVHFRVRTKTAAHVDPLDGWLEPPRFVGRAPSLPSSSGGGALLALLLVALLWWS